MNGALLLGIISLVTVTDVMIAFFFLARARQAEGAVGAAPDTTAGDPAAFRRLARMLFITAPLMWLVVAFLSFGIIPVGGIVPIKL